MPCFRRVVPVLAAVALVGIARAEPEPPAPVDAARLNEQYVIEPGTEALVADMLGSGQTLPGGCTFRDGTIERTSVLAIYACSGGEIVLQLLHPGIAPRGSVRTQRFAVTVKSGAPPTGLVDAVAERIRGREATFEWKNVGGQSPGGALILRWLGLIAAGVVIAVLAFWALSRLAARRRRPA